MSRLKQPSASNSPVGFGLTRMMSSKEIIFTPGDVRAGVKLFSHRPVGSTTGRENST
jgi:hypothetical protein